MSYFQSMSHFTDRLSKSPYWQYLCLRKLNKNKKIMSEEKEINEELNQEATAETTADSHENSEVKVEQTAEEKYAELNDKFCDISCSSLSINILTPSNSENS